MYKVITLGRRPDRLTCSPWLEKRCYYSKKLPNQSQWISFKLFGEIKAQFKKNGEGLNLNLKNIESELKDINSSLKRKGEKKQEESIKKEEFIDLLTSIKESQTSIKESQTSIKESLEPASKRWKLVKWAGGTLVGAAASPFFVSYFQNMQLYLKKDISYVYLSDKISLHKEDWIHTKNLTALKDTFKAQESSNQKVALIGASGSGKTTLAKQFVQQYEQESRAQSDTIITVFFGDMLDYNTFLNTYRKFAEDLGIKLHSNASNQEIINEVNKKLRKRPNWLFVVDNVDSRDYEKLQIFFPKSKKGKILLISQEKLKGLMSFDMQINTLSKEEALRIFNINLGKDHWAYKQASNSKRELAYQLCYLPLAIKQAAIYLKNAEQVSSFDVLINSYIDQIKSLMKVPQADPLHIYDPGQILKAIYSVNIKECNIKQSNCDHIFSIVPFLNPHFIDESLLKLWFQRQGAKMEFLGPILDLLESYSLITLDGDNGWEMHSSFQELLIEKAKKEQKDPAQILKEVLIFFKDTYKLDMRFAKGLNKTQAIENQLGTLLKHAEKYNSLEEFKHYFVHLYNVLGNYHLQSNNFFEARQAFEKSLELVGVQITSMTAEQICENLNKQGEIPALCSQAIHYLGKVYFQTRELDQAKKYFQKAIDIQKIIAANPHVYKNANPFDFLIFQRQGIGWALLEGDKDDLLQAEKLYLSLFKQNPCMPAGQRDVFNERYCNIQLSRVYLKLAQTESNEEEKKKYYNKARERLETGGIENGMPFQGATQMKQQYTRSGEICLILGELYLDRDCPFRDLDRAQKCFKEAPEISKTDLMIGAKSKYYLAKLYLEKGLINQAYNAIIESIQLFKKIGGKGLTRIVPQAFYEAERLKEAFCIF
jgi:tetratricopeptide (TPR) repeat protein